MKRIMVTIAGQGSIASVIRTGLLKKIKGFCVPVVCILWEQPDLIAELRSEGFEVHIFPTLSYSKKYLIIRKKINFGYLRYVLKTRSTKIEANYKRHFLSWKKRIRKSIEHL